MEEQINPMLEPENYMSGYNEEIAKLRNDPAVVAFDKLCYEVFSASEMGERFLNFAKERFLIHSQIARGNANYESDVLWQEGFRDAYRMIIQSVISHQQRIKAGA